MDARRTIRIGQGLLGTILPATLVAAGIGLLMAGPVRAERIITKSGTTFTGQILKDEGGKVVVKTVSGSITVSRDDIATIEKDVPDSQTVALDIVPVDVKPERAAEALQQAKAAMSAEEWLKAGALLEGIGRLDPSALALEDRQTAAAGLATCYLQMGDGGGACRAFVRRATLESDEPRKRQILAAAEALRTTKGVRIGDQEVRTYGAAIPIAAKWKSQRLVEEAKALVTSGRMYGVPQRALRTAQAAIARLQEADEFAPGSGSQRRQEILKALVDDILGGVRKAIDFCTKERQYLDDNRWQSLSNKEIVKGWAGRLMNYLSVRQEAENALANLKPLAEKLPDKGLYNPAEVEGLQARLQDLKFYPRGSGKHRVRILPYRTAP